MDKNIHSRKSNFKYILSDRQLVAALGIIVLAIAIVAATIFSIRYFKSQSKKPEVVVESNKEVVYPSGWKTIKSADNNTIVRLEKESKAKVKPVLVLTSSRADVKDFASYVDKLIKGAKSTIPSLRYISNKDTSKDGVYSRTLEGYYSNSGNRVRIYQKVIIKSGTVYTLTISYAEGDITPAELEELVNSTVSQNIK